MESVAIPTFPDFLFFGMLREANWPRKTGTFKKTEAVDPRFVDFLMVRVAEMSVTLGAGSPKLAAQLLADIFRDRDWEDQPLGDLLHDLDPSPALSIIQRGPQRFEGRKLGVLVTDGADSTLFQALKAGIEKEKAVIEVIAPKVGGVTLSDGKPLAAQQMIDGGPSVLYDAVVVLASEEGAGDLLKEAAARDFVADAFAHCKFIGYTKPAFPLLEMAGAADLPDEGTVEIDGADAVAGFLKGLGALRVWAREPSVKLP